MSFIQDQRVVGILAIGAVLWFYYQRVNRAKVIRQSSATSQPVEKQLKETSKYAFVHPRDRIQYPGDWQINLGGVAREGQYGIERRDYKDSVGGTKVVTHTDAWINV